MKKNKISLKNGYTLTINEDDTLHLTVTTVEGETLEVDGKSGYLMEESDMEAWFEEDHTELTTAELKIGAYAFLKDWGIDEETAMVILEELTPWFQRYAIKQPEADAWLKVLKDRVEQLKLKEELHRKNISDEAKRFKKWVANASEYDIVDEAMYKAQIVTEARETYRAVWKEYKEAQAEMFRYKEAMHI